MLRAEWMHLHAHTRGGEGPRDVTSVLPKWAWAQQGIPGAVGRAETCCQELLIQNNALAWAHCFVNTWLGRGWSYSNLALPHFSYQHQLCSAFPSPPASAWVKVFRISCWNSWSGSLVADQSSILRMARNVWWETRKLIFCLNENADSQSWSHGDFCPLCRIKSSKRQWVCMM